MASASIATLVLESFNTTHVIFSSKKLRINVSGTISYSSHADQRGSPARGTLVYGFSNEGRLQTVFRFLCRRPPVGNIVLLHGLSTARRPVIYSQTAWCCGTALLGSYFNPIIVPYFPPDANPLDLVSPTNPAFQRASYRSTCLDILFCISFACRFPGVYQNYLNKDKRLLLLQTHVSYPQPFLF